MKEKKLNGNKNENPDLVKVLVLIFEMGVIFLSCAVCMLILISSLPLVIKTAAFGLFAFVIKALVKHLTTISISQN